MTFKHRDFFFRLTPVVLTQTAGLACGIIGVKLASQYVPPNILGDYGIFMSFTTLGMWVVHAGLIKYVTRHWAGAESKAAFLRRMVQLWFAKLPWIVFGSLGAVLAIAQLTEQNSWGLLPSMLIISGVLSLVAMGHTALQVNRDHWTDFGVSAIGSLTRTFLPLGLFLLIGSAAGLYAGLTFHILIGIGAIALVMRRYWRAPSNSASANFQVDQIYTGSYFTILALAGWALTGANRWVVAGNFGNVEAGYFILASNIALIVPTFAGTVMTQLFQPGIFAMGDGIAANNRRPLLGRIDTIAGAFCALSIAGVYVLNSILPWLIGPLIHANYNAALHWVLPVGLFGTAVIVGQFYHTLLLAARMEKSCAPVDLTTAGILIVGSALAACFGRQTFTTWLLVTPLVPLVITRTLARAFLFRAP